MTIKRIKKEEKNIFSSPRTNSGFMLITFSHDYTGQNVSQAAHAAIFHLFAEDYDDFHVLFVEKQTGRQCRKNSSSQLSSQPTAWRPSHIYWLKEKKEHMVSSKKHQKNPHHFAARTWHSHEHDMKNHPNKLWPQFHFACRGQFSSWEIIIQMTNSSKLLWIIKIHV